MTAPAYPPDLLARISSLCEADPEREVCGFVVRRGGALEVLPVENVADRYHARNPRPSRGRAVTATSWTRAPSCASTRSWPRPAARIVAVWHSHVEVGAYFSEKDRADAAVDGAQVLPGVEYLVFGVRGGRVTEVKRYRFEAAGFQEDPLD